MKLRKTILCVLLAGLLLGVNSLGLADEKNEQIEGKHMSYGTSHPLVGYPIEIYGYGLEEDEKLVYQVNGNTKEFTASYDRIYPSNEPVAFYIVPDEPGEWECISINGKAYEKNDLDFVAHEPVKTYDLKVTRIKGDDRYQTALEISKNAYDKAESLVIASGENYPDGIFAGPFANTLNSPLLLTARDQLAPGIREELQRLGTKKIYLVGGERSISNGVENELRSLGYETERIAGDNRYETAKEIGRKTIEVLGLDYSGDRAIIVNETNFADALTAAPYMSSYRERTNYYAAFVPYYGHFGLDSKPMPEFSYVIGGKASVPEAENEIRHGGDNRYDTALEVAKAYRHNLGQNKTRLVLVDGTNFVDALAGGSFAYDKNAAILLTRPDEMPEGLLEYIKEENIEEVIIIGGDSSVSEEIEKQIRALSY